MSSLAPAEFNSLSRRWLDWSGLVWWSQTDQDIPGHILSLGINYNQYLLSGARALSLLLNICYNLEYIILG